MMVTQILEKEKNTPVSQSVYFIIMFEKRKTFVVIQVKRKSTLRTKQYSVASN